MDNNIARRIIDDVLDFVEKHGASYADVRLYLDDQGESLSVKNEVVESASIGSESGAGVRVLKNGSWGFASFSDLSRPESICRHELFAAAREALALAETSSRLRSFPLELAPLGNVPLVANYETSYSVDPFSVPISEKIALLKDACAALNDASGKIAVRTSELTSGRFTKMWAAFERGLPQRRYITQTFRSCAFELFVLAIDGDEVQERSFGHGGIAHAGGLEFIHTLNVQDLATQLRSEAHELLTAPECEPGMADIIILPHHLGLHVHETGHAFEGDRLLGYEQTYVGGTFINEIIADIGSYPFGSEAVNIVAEATFPGGYGTFAFDDEGVPAQSFHLVEQGIIKNVLTSRETVQQINRRIGRNYFTQSNGTMRAASYTRMPLIRMTNISLLPGNVTLSDLIGRLDRGLLLEGTQSWSMSEDRKNFDFGVQYASEIRNGKIGRVVRNAGYTGNNLAFWRSCEAIAGEHEAYMLNVPNCGKGMPGQSMSTGHRTSPALFRNVEVFNRKQRGGS